MILSRRALLSSIPALFVTPALAEKRRTRPKYCGNYSLYEGLNATSENLWKHRELRTYRGTLHYYFVTFKEEYEVGLLKEFLKPKYVLQSFGYIYRIKTGNSKYVKTIFFPTECRPIMNKEYKIIGFWDFREQI